MIYICDNGGSCSNWDVDLIRCEISDVPIEDMIKFLTLRTRLKEPPTILGTTSFIFWVLENKEVNLEDFIEPHSFFIHTTRYRNSDPGLPQHLRFRDYYDDVEIDAEMWKHTPRAILDYLAKRWAGSVGDEDIETKRFLDVYKSLYPI